MEWNGGMEWWNGTVEWNSGMTTPIEQSLPDNLYPKSDNRVVRSRMGDNMESAAGNFPSVFTSLLVVMG